MRTLNNKTKCLISLLGICFFFVTRDKMRTYLRLYRKVKFGRGLLHEPLFCEDFSKC